jgi:hypothetical protein
MAKDSKGHGSNKRDIGDQRNVPMGERHLPPLTQKAARAIWDSRGANNVKTADEWRAHTRKSGGRTGKPTSMAAQDARKQGNGGMSYVLHADDRVSRVHHLGGKTYISTASPHEGGLPSEKKGKVRSTTKNERY